MSDNNQNHHAKLDRERISEAINSAIEELEESGRNGAAAAGLIEARDLIAQSQAHARAGQRLETTDAELFAALVSDTPIAAADYALLALTRAHETVDALGEAASYGNGNGTACGGQSVSDALHLVDNELGRARAVLSHLVERLSG